jgi:uncharacterized protein
MTEPERPVADWLQDEPWAQVAETHAAVVFLAGDRACKLKKPVNLGFLDFSTAEARAAACTREVELNRKFASDVYLGVAEIRGPDGQVCEEMRAIAEPWPDAIVIDTERGGTAGLPGECLGQVLAAIRPHDPEHVWRPTLPYMLPG